MLTIVKGISPASFTLIVAFSAEGNNNDPKSTDLLNRLVLK